MSHPSRVRVTGPLASYAEGFAAQLAEQGYRPNAAANQLQLLAHLSRWLALAWACQPQGGEANWWGYRLSAVRGFANYLHATDLTVEVPPRDLLPCRAHRASPYLYSEQETAALIAAASMLHTPLRVATYQTLIGLLAVTGMRVGEAIGLDRHDFDASQGVLIIRHAKFNKTRELPLHATTVAALRRYLGCHERRRCAMRTAALFISSAGTRLLYCNVQWTFQRLVRHAGLVPRTSWCRPRIHDLRHASQ
jgi:integrase/recombinase XerD